MITIELYTTRKEVMALQAKGLSDKEIARELELIPAIIPRVINKEVFVDFRMSSTSPKKVDDHGALLQVTDPTERETQLRKLVYCRVKKMGYHFSQKRLDQIYNEALRNAE